MWGRPNKWLLYWDWLWLRIYPILYQDWLFTFAWAWLDWKKKGALALIHTRNLIIFLSLCLFLSSSFWFGPFPLILHISQVLPSPQNHHCFPCKASFFLHLQTDFFFRVVFFFFTPLHIRLSILWAVKWATSSLENSSITIQGRSLLGRVTFVGGGSQNCWFRLFLNDLRGFETMQRQRFNKAELCSDFPALYSAHRFILQNILTRLLEEKRANAR